MRRARLSVFLSSVFVCGLLLCAPAPASADADGASVSGTIVDQLGGVIRAAAVSLVRDGRVVERTATDAAGRFTFAVTEAGRYAIEAQSPGFLVRRLDPFFVASGARVTLTVTLSIGIDQMETVTAAATALPVSQVAAPVTVVDRMTIARTAAPAVVDALRLIPGVNVVQAGARGASASLFVRGGASTFNKVLVDGVPANDIGGAFDFADLSTAGVDRVEVLRDANSVLYGSDALAGVIDITTRRGTSRTPELEYSGDAGTFGTHSHQLAFGGAAGRIDYFAAMSDLDTDNAVANAAHRNRTFAGRLGWRSSHTDVSAVYHAGTARTGLPSAVDYFGMSDDSRKDADSQLFSLTAVSRVSANVTMTVSAAIAHAGYHTINPAPTGEAYDPYGFGPNYLGTPVTVVGGNGYRTSGRAILDYGGVYPSRYDAATNRRLLSARATYQFAHGIDLSAGARVEHEDGTARFASNPASTTGRNNRGAFLDVQAVRGRVMVNAGLGVEDNAVFGVAATPRASAVWYLRHPSAPALVGDTRVMANAGTGIKAPNIDQELSSLYAIARGAGLEIAGLGPIGPERSRSVDVGIEQALWGGHARLRASYFQNVFTDVIEFVNKSALTSVGVPAEAAAATDFGAYVNSQSYRASGLELSGEAAIARMRFAASYTFLDAEVMRSFSSDVLAPAENPAFPGVRIGAYSPLVGARPFRRPTHVANVLASYAHGPIDVTWVAWMSGRQDDSTFLSDQDFGPSLLLPNHDLVPAFAKVDLSGGYRVVTGLRWYASIENLFDRAYEAAAGFPGLGRTFRTGVAITVGGDRVTSDD